MLFENPLEIFFGVGRDGVSISPLGKLEEEEPIDTAFWTANDKVRLVLSEDGVEGPRLDTLTRVRDSEDAPVVTRNAWKMVSQNMFEYPVAL